VEDSETELLLEVKAKPR